MNSIWTSLTRWQSSFFLSSFDGTFRPEGLTIRYHCFSLLLCAHGRVVLAKYRGGLPLPSSGFFLWVVSLVPHLVAFYDHLGRLRAYSEDPLNPHGDPIYIYIYIYVYIYVYI